MIKKMNGEKFTLENHTRNNGVEWQEIESLLKGDKCKYADEIIGFTTNPSYINRVWWRPMWGLMFQKNGEEFWIHLFPEDLEFAIYKVFGEVKAKEILQGSSWN